MIPIRYVLLLVFLVISFLLLSAKTFCQTCNNWLQIPDQFSAFKIGDLDISGQQLTVEASFNRTTPWSGVDLFQGDLVSKHLTPTDCNYLLRPGSAEITTSAGYFKTPAICPIELNKTYHVAMVYDGKVLKFYRNGFLMSQVAATGDLFQNDFPTQIGLRNTTPTVPESLVGYINEVRIWNTARTQTEIKAYMAQSLPNPQTTAGLLAYYTFDNLLNKQGNTAWNGSLLGNSSVNAVNTNCNFKADSCGVSLCATLPKPDYSFNQEVCSPTLRLTTNLADVKTYEWDFGDGQINSTSAAPLVNYNSYGTYNLKLKVTYNSGCKDSITKPITIKLQQSGIIITPDSRICSGDSVTAYMFAGALNNCWTPSTGVTVLSPLTAILKPSVTTTYSFTTKVLQTELFDGRFELGNNGFSSAYNYASSGTSAGTYTLSTTPSSWSPGLSSCGDHTRGYTNMMVVRGDQRQNAVVWTRTVTLAPNTNYMFLFWLASLKNSNPAQLQLAINGNLIGDVINASTQTCVWEHFFTTWNSGSTTTATLTILNLNSAKLESDFALDDISFGEIAVQKDSITVFVNPVPVVDAGNDISVCSGSNAQLAAKVTGATSIRWTPSTYLNNAGISNPLVTPTSDIKYVAEAISSSGCKASDSLRVTVMQKPVINLLKDTGICKGSSLILSSAASNATTYRWQPTNGLTNPVSISPAAKPDFTTRYILTAANAACRVQDSVLITVNPLPVTSIVGNTALCEGGQVQLFATGGLNYTWSPVNGLSANNVPNPIASPQVTTTYAVTIQAANGCSKQDSVQIFVSKKPVFTVQPSSQSICSGSTAVITASGGDTYLWTPSNTVVSANTATTKVSPDQTTTYQVYVKSAACNIDSILSAVVTINPLPVVSITKSNDISCTITSSLLKASGGRSYLWSPGTTLSDSTVYNPVAAPRQTTVYTVLVKDANGCANTDSTKVEVSVSGESLLSVPSAFTPNNDGLNDCFGVRNAAGLEKLELSVYNRFGERVFFTNSAGACWDGKFKNADQPEGTYVYYVKTRSLCGNTMKKGTVILIR